MDKMTPDMLRAAFKDVDEPVLPPGSMTLETAETVANRFADAWEAEHEELLRFRSGASKLQDYIEELEKRLDDARQAWLKAASECGDLRKRLEAATDPIRMAAIIRGVDGKHELGAAELAERICAALAGKETEDAQSRHLGS